MEIKYSTKNRKFKDIAKAKLVPGVEIREGISV